MKKYYQNKQGVIVLGGHVQGYGIVRIFGESNIPSIVIDSSANNIAKHSKYCKCFYLADYKNVLKLLDKFKAKNEYKNWVIFPTDDYYVRLLSKNKDDLEKHFKVTVDRWEIVNIFFDKTNSYPLAEKVGIPIPKTFYTNYDNKLLEIKKSITYPCVIKPAIMKDFYAMFKKKVFICNNQIELEENFSIASSKINPENLIIQEVIPGCSYNQYSVGVFFDRNKSYNHLVVRRAHQHPIDFGNATTFAETVDLPILIDYAEKILSAANYWGLCEVEFKYDERDEKYKFLEVNPRTWKWHLISKIAKIHFLESMYGYCIENKPIIKKNYEIVSWQDILTDFPIAIIMKIKGLYKQRSKKKNIQAVWNMGDIKPFLFQLLYIPYNFLKR